VDALVATAETVTGPGPGPTPVASAEETECVLRWLEQPGVRLVEADGPWHVPAFGAGRYRDWLEAAEAGRRALTVLDDRRGLRPEHRPAR
jgi:DNA polymerase III subunit epsilon